MRAARRTLNFTQRRKIEDRHILVVAKREGNSGRVELQVLNFDSYELPDGAPIILEVLTRRDGARRCDLGTTPHPKIAGGIELHPDFFDSARVRLKILHPDGSGRIIAAADDVDYETPDKAGTRSLLPALKVDDLGDRIWRLRTDPNGFLLEINRSFPRIDEVIRQPAFLALAMPDILRQIALALTDNQCEVAHAVQEKWTRLFANAFIDPTNLREEDPAQWADEVASRLVKDNQLTRVFRDQIGDDE
jgi:hypothetical protein